MAPNGPSDGQTLLIVRRRASPETDRRRRYHVYVDGRKVGTLRPGGVLRFQVEPGRHRVRFRVDWCFSERVVARCGPGTATVVHCAPAIPYRGETPGEGPRLLSRLFLHPRHWIAARVDRIA